MKKKGWIISIFFIILLIIGASQDDGKTDNSNVKKNEQSENTINTEEIVESPKEVEEEIVKWNVKNENALENGNIKKAIKLLIGKNELSNEAIQIDSVDAYKAPWNYYGKIVAISGEVAFAEDYPPQSDLSKKFGSETVSNITIITEEGVVVSLLSTISSSKINRGSMAIIYGYIVGRGQLVQNSQGGNEIGLVMIGNQVRVKSYE